MAKILVLFASLFFAIPAFGANLQCQKKTDTSFMKLFFCPCKSRVESTFRTDVGGEFSAGQKVDVTIDGVSVGKMKLTMTGDKLTARMNQNKKINVAVKAGSMAQVGGLSCKLK